MTDFERCCNDLDRWGIGFVVGKFYDNNDVPEMKYIETASEYIKFDLNGNYVDTE